MKSKVVALVAVCLGMIGVAQADTTTANFSGDMGVSCAFRSAQAGVMKTDPSNFENFGTTYAGASPAQIGLEWIGSPTLEIGGASPLVLSNSQGTLPASYMMYQTATFGLAANNTAAQTAGMQSNWQSTSGAKSITLTGTDNQDFINLNTWVEQPNGVWPAGTYTTQMILTCS